MPFARIAPAAFVALLGLLAAAAPARAQPPLNACTITATGVAFGTYDPKSATPDSGYGTIALDCHPSARPVIALGAGFGGSLLERRMRNGASSPVYNLYTDAGFSRVWGDGTGGTVTVPVERRTSTTTVYGRIPPGQNVTAGTYSDTLIVTVVF